MKLLPSSATYSCQIDPVRQYFSGAFAHGQRYILYCREVGKTLYPRPLGLVITLTLAAANGILTISGRPPLTAMKSHEATPAT